MSLPEPLWCLLLWYLNQLKVVHFAVYIYILLSFYGLSVFEVIGNWSILFYMYAYWSLLWAGLVDHTHTSGAVLFNCWRYHSTNLLYFKLRGDLRNDVLIVSVCCVVIIVPTQSLNECHVLVFHENQGSWLLRNFTSTYG